MRLFCRVFLIVLLIVVAARAADTRQPIATEQTFTVQRQADTVNSADKLNVVIVPSARVPLKFPSEEIQLRPTCLTMRSMIFSRSGTDRVHYQRTTTCTPANQFQVKHAVVPVVLP